MNKATMVLAHGIFVAAALFCAQARAGGDAAAGKTVFANQCSSCHTTEAGKNGFGPSMARVVGRKAGGLAGFRYSPAMAQAAPAARRSTASTPAARSAAA